MMYKAEFYISEADKLKFLDSLGLKVELEEREFLEDTSRDVKRITQKIRVVRRCDNDEEYPDQKQRGWEIPHEWQVVDRIIEKLLTDRLRKLLMPNLTSDVTTTATRRS